MILFLVSCFLFPSEPKLFPEPELIKEPPVMIQDVGVNHKGLDLWLVKKDREMHQKSYVSTLGGKLFRYYKVVLVEYGGGVKDAFPDIVVGEGFSLTEAVDNALKKWNRLEELKKK